MQPADSRGINSASTSPAHVREAVIGDVPALAAVHLECWLATYRGVIAEAYLDSLDQQTFEGYHRPRFKDGATADGQPFLVVCDRPAGELIGFARGGPIRQNSPTGDPLPPVIVESFAAEVYAIYLLPEHHGRGIGWALFREVSQRLHDRGHRSLCVWVLARNHKGRTFYERAGGQLVPGKSHVTLGGAGYEHIAYGWPDITSILNPAATL